MPTTYKVLGQSAPSANVATDLYTVPAATNAVTSTISICNQNSSNVSFRLAVRPNGNTLATQHYIVFNNVVVNNDTMLLTIGMSLNATDVVTVFANTANVSFSLFGTEIS